MMIPNVLLAFIILSLGIYLGRGVVDFILARFHIFSRKHNSPNLDGGGGELLETLPPDFDIPTNSLPNLDNCLMESVCAEAVENVEGLSEGISIAIETAGEQLANILEGL